MIVVHIESGLGNQMLSYCEFLALQHTNPNEKIYIENIIYEIDEANKYINQWNGYELNKVFNIKAPNIKELFSEVEWSEIINEIKQTEFWKKNWNYPKYFTEVLNKHGLKLKNIRGDFENNYKKVQTNFTKLSILEKLKQTRIYSNIRRYYYIIYKNTKYRNNQDVLFYKTNESVFTGQRLKFKLRDNNIGLIDKEIRKSFVFPKLDKKNLEFKKILEENNSVAIHVRRGDMLNTTGKHYKNGYFKRATRLIKKKVKNPLFVFFCDTTCGDWCKNNLKVFGLKKDEVLFVDWNAGTDSYKDMQLMVHCKHNIVTVSTFGWWGAYLNTNPNKITISPEFEINTTHHC